MILRLAGLVLLLFLSAAPVAADDLYVDNLLGDDVFDARTSTPVSRASGPVRSIDRALALARPTDRIHLVNTGRPYYASLRMMGPRHSGRAGAPFTIYGNGAVLSGAVLVPESAWQEVGQRLWRFTPSRKGHYQLLRDGVVVPEVPVESAARELPALPDGHWCAWRGSIYCRLEQDVDPRGLGFGFAATPFGISLWNMRHVVIRDLVLQHFRVDGVNAHDLCSDVVLENVTVLGCGRSGVTVAGSSSVLLRQCRLVDNRLYQLLITEHGHADVANSTLSTPPVID